MLDYFRIQVSKIMTYLKMQILKILHFLKMQALNILSSIRVCILKIINSWKIKFLSLLNWFYMSFLMILSFWKAYVAILLILVSVFLVYEFGRIKAGFDSIEAKNIEQSSLGEIALLESEIEALNREIAILTTNIQVDRESYKVVEESLISLQAKIQEQRDVINFYRGILSPLDGYSGLRIQDLKLTNGKSEGEFNIRLVLTQSMNYDRKVSGSVNVSVIGKQSGTKKSYNISDLLLKDSDISWIFSFRYFQDFEKQMVLPNNFIPELIKVEVQSKVRSISSIEQEYDWVVNQS